MLITEFSSQRGIQAKHNGVKYGKPLYKLMNNTAYVKKLEDVRNTIDVSNEKGHLKWTSKPSSISQKVFENDLVAILKVKILLTLNKSAYIGLYILDLGKVLKYGFHYD